MQVELEIKNYRCFEGTKPARIIIQPGFTALVGVNNSGKSSLLRFFYEFRQLFRQLASPGNIEAALQGNPQGFSPPIHDLNSLFCDFNDRDIEIQFRFGKDSVVESSAPPVPNQVVITVQRGTGNWRATLHIGGRPTNFGNLSVQMRETVLHVDGNLKVELSPMFEVCRDLSETMYVGAFRHTIQVGSAPGGYYDIQIGQAMISAWRQWKTGSTRSHNEAAIKLTNDIKQIFEFDSLANNPSPEDRNLQVFVNERSSTLPELGSGLTQFFLVLANAAMKHPSYILIDEPELNLHPSLQLDFLTTLASYASKGVLFSTHSIGLARAAGNKVYSVHKEPGGPSEGQVIRHTVTVRVSREIAFL